MPQLGGGFGSHTSLWRKSVGLSKLAMAQLQEGLAPEELMGDIDGAEALRCFSWEGVGPTRVRGGIQWG